jgi:hypothetical protein
LSLVVDDVWGNVSLRWIFVHMIEETARHAGHLDLMREQIDGRTGDCVKAWSVDRYGAAVVPDGREIKAVSRTLRSDHGPSSPCVDTAVMTKHRGRARCPCFPATARSRPRPVMPRPTRRDPGRARRS